MCTKLGSEKGLGSRFSVLGYLGFVQTKCSALKRRRWLVQKCFFCQPPNTKASKAGRQFGISYPSATPKPLSRTSSQYASRQGHMFHLRPATKKATSVLDNIERGISANSDETGKTVGFLRYCFCPPPNGTHWSKRKRTFYCTYIRTTDLFWQQLQALSARSCRSLARNLHSSGYTQSTCSQGGGPCEGFEKRWRTTTTSVRGV